MKYEGEQVLSLRQIKKLSIYCFVLVGGLSFFCNEAMSHHTAKDGDLKERVSIIKDGE